MQVAEHPTLASVREYLLVAQKKTPQLCPQTTSKKGPTPIVIENVMRVASINVSKIYGNKFAFADFNVIQNAVKKLSPPLFATNILAMVRFLPIFFLNPFSY